MFLLSSKVIDACPVTNLTLQGRAVVLPIEKTIHGLSVGTSVVFVLTEHELRAYSTATLA